ncbi:hypothetical protein M758_UG328400 [Ceratodon purpureus]|nr:hypothetical protein M758_UG328400 [Ceratodon purpureus]KAG0597323.1 hypothetical protein M758_UG328400 [Ceratodon purpureus]
MSLLRLLSSPCLGSFNCALCFQPLRSLPVCSLHCLGVSCLCCAGLLQCTSFFPFVQLLSASLYNLGSACFLQSTVFLTLYLLRLLLLFSSRAFSFALAACALASFSRTAAVMYYSEVSMINFEKSMIGSRDRIFALAPTVGSVRNIVIDPTPSAISSKLTTSSTTAGLGGSLSTKKCSTAESGTVSSSTSMVAVSSTSMSAASLPGMVHKSKPTTLASRTTSSVT